MVLVVLVVLTQYSLWFGKEGWLVVRQRRAEVAAGDRRYAELLRRNQQLEATVYDLVHGRDVIDERARYQLGLVKPSEIFYYVYRNQTASKKLNRSPAVSSQNAQQTL